MSSIVDLLQLSAVLDLNTKPWLDALGSAAAGAVGFGTLLEGVMKGIETAVDLIAPHIQEAFNPARALEMAVQFDASMRRISADFGSAHNAAIGFSDSMISGLGLSQEAAISMISHSGALFNEMGFGKTQAEQLGETVAKLALDMAAFSNSSPTDTLHAIDAALAGNTQSLRQYGLHVTMQMVQMELQREGYYGNVMALNQQQRAIASLNTVIRESVVMQGAAEQQANSYQGVMQALRGSFEDVTLSIGERLEPAVLHAIDTMGGVKQIKADMESVGDAIVSTTKFFVQLVTDIDVYGKVAWQALSIALKEVWADLVQAGGSLSTVLGQIDWGNVLLETARGAWAVLITVIAAIGPVITTAKAGIQDTWDVVVISAVAMAKGLEAVWLRIAEGIAFITNSDEAWTRVNNIKASLADLDATDNEYAQAVLDRTKAIDDAWDEMGKIVAHALSVQVPKSATDAGDAIGGMTGVFSDGTSIIDQDLSGVGTAATNSAAKVKTAAGTASAAMASYAASVNQDQQLVGDSITQGYNWAEDGLTAFGNLLNQQGAFVDTLAQQTLQAQQIMKTLSVR